MSGQQSESFLQGLLELYSQKHLLMARILKKTHNMSRLTEDLTEEMLGGFNEREELMGRIDKIDRKITVLEMELSTKRRNPDFFHSNESPIISKINQKRQATLKLVYIIQHLDQQLKQKVQFQFEVLKENQGKFLTNRYIAKAYRKNKPSREGIFVDTKE